MKKGLKLGTWHNASGQNYMGLGGSNNGQNKKRKSTKGYYHVAFVKEYTRLTEKDLDLNIDYGKDLVSQYTGVPEDMITLRKKSERQTLTSIDTVYYVRRGVETIGKLSIRAQRRFKELGLVFIYMEKNYAPKELRRLSKGSQGFTTQSKSTKRQLNRKKDKPKSTN